MEIGLINPKLVTWSPNVYLPLGLAYIASALENAGHSVDIIDMNSNKVTDNELIDRISKVSVVGITGMITEYREIIRLATVSKKVNKEAKVLLGGALATTQTDKMLESSQADIVVLGEGEETIIELVSAIESGKDINDIKGIAFKDNGKVVTTLIREPIANLDTIAYPARHLVDMHRYTTHHFKSFGIKVPKVKSTTMLTSRGCPFSCTFCYKDMWGHKWRGRSPENMIGEIRQLTELGFNALVFNDDTFVMDKQRVINFCKQLIDSKLRVSWYCNGRVNLMTREMLEVMHEAGCVGIGYGLESGNQQVLDLIKKGITLEQVRQVVKWTKEFEINITGYFVLGLLGETKANIEDTIKFAREINLNFYAFAIMAPFPGTPIYNAAKEKGLIGDEELTDWSDHAIANLTQDCSIKDLEHYNAMAFREFTIQKRYGKHYLLNPLLWLEGLRSVIFLIGKRSYKQLLRKSWGVIVGK